MFSCNILSRFHWGPGEILLCCKNREPRDLDVGSKEYAVRLFYLSDEEFVECDALSDFSALATTLGIELREAIGDSVPIFCVALAKRFIEIQASVHGWNYFGEEDTYGEEKLRKEGKDTSFLRRPVLVDHSLRFFASRPVGSRDVMFDTNIDLDHGTFTEKPVADWKGFAIL